MGVRGLNHREAVRVAYCICNIWHVDWWDVTSVQEISEMRRQSLFKQLLNVSWKQAWSSRQAGPDMRGGNKRVHCIQSPTYEKRRLISKRCRCLGRFIGFLLAHLWKFHNFYGEFGDVRLLRVVLSDAEWVATTFCWRVVWDCLIPVLLQRPWADLWPLCADRHDEKLSSAAAAEKKACVSNYHHHQRTK